MENIISENLVHFEPVCQKEIESHTWIKSNCCNQQELLLCAKVTWCKIQTDDLICKVCYSVAFLHSIRNEVKRYALIPLNSCNNSLIRNILY